MMGVPMGRTGPSGRPRPQRLSMPSNCSDCTCLVLMVGKVVVAMLLRVQARFNYPKVEGGCSQEDFKFFRRTWNQCVRASIENNDGKLKDQLLHCPDDTLRKAVDRAQGDRVDTIYVVDLLKEIEMLAIVRQSNLVNTLALMTAKQERDEPVRQFAARLHCLAALCDLKVTCTCQLKVSEVDKWVHMTLISGLND